MQTSHIQLKRISYAASIIGSYDGKIPFHLFLKQYFKQHKKFGSADRKAIAEACFSYWRLGKSFPETDVVRRIGAAIFLCNDNSVFWKDDLTLSFDERLQETKKIYPEFVLQNVFRFSQAIHPSIGRHEWQQSFLKQPDVFLRIRPGMQLRVLQSLKNSGLACHVEDDSNTCVRLPPSAKVDDYVVLDLEAVVQDKNSQRVVEPLKPFAGAIKSVWDCCAASGGKSILLYDTLPAVQIHASDVRSSILHNLRKRFQRAAITGFTSSADDLTMQRSSGRMFDLVVCDVPCTGSGTWSRSPEQLVFFQEKEIFEYQTKQRKIVSHAIHHVKRNGLLLYITCSVFSAENEDNVASFVADLNLELLSSEIFSGYADKADTLYAALLRKPV